ncbi:conserved hypothetical protein [Gammaproteobacteria bacterium]
MKKSYSQFTADDIQELGLRMVRSVLFGEIKSIQASDWLLRTLEINREIPSNSEKAKSELFIAPVLTDITLRNRDKMTYFSGYRFNVDSKRGLKGFCDFIISKKHDAAFIESPLAAVVEAKYHQDLADVVPQCAAEMFAAQLFNERKGDLLPFIYGAVTNGYEWLFLRLKEQTFDQVQKMGESALLLLFPKMGRDAYDEGRHHRRE